MAQTSPTRTAGRAPSQGSERSGDAFPAPAWVWGGCGCGVGVGVSVGVGVGWVWGGVGMIASAALRLESFDRGIETASPELCGDECSVCSHGGYHCSVPLEVPSLAQDTEFHRVPTAHPAGRC